VNQEEREQNGVDGIKKGKVVICIEKDVDDPARPTLLTFIRRKRRQCSKCTKGKVVMTLKSPKSSSQSIC